MEVVGVLNRRDVCVGIIVVDSMIIGASVQAWMPRGLLTLAELDSSVFKEVNLSRAHKIADDEDIALFDMPH